MGARILRIELRRSVALWATVLIAAIGVFVLFASNPPYRSWMELAMVQRDIMQLTWPLRNGRGSVTGPRAGARTHSRAQSVCSCRSALAVARSELWGSTATSQGPC